MNRKRLQADLGIAGGGMAGVCAALAAARAGARVVLIQDRSVLGGNASSEIRMHIVGASCSGRRPGARESGILEELRLDDAVHNPHRSPFLFDLLLYDKIRREPNITLLLDACCVGCRREGSAIRSVHAVRNLTEEAFDVEAPFFADCTGDGRLGFEAGAEHRMGREGRSEFGESLAPPAPDAKTLGSSILFMARRHDRPVRFEAPPWARRFTEAQLKFRSHREYEYGYWWMEWGGELDTIRDNDRIRHELLAIALGVWDHVKNGCRCPAEDSASRYDKWREAAETPREDPSCWALEWVGMLPGKRESRRFLGPHILTQHDVLEGRLPDDTVAYGGWWIDTHPPGGVDAAEEYPCTQHPVPYLYGIPLRCLYSRNIDNLFFAGRIISATHIAFASTRVMGTCAVVGQAVGAAAALAARTGCRRIVDLDARQVQQLLLKQDAFLPGFRNDDPADAARAATVTVSSAQPDAPGEAILDGITRATHPQLHPALGEAGHQWRSAGMPAWIELRWPRPLSIREVRITFDTGFERELTLTMSDVYNSRMIRGPQPETVSDYTLSAEGGWELAVRGNYQRLRTHRLDEPLRTGSLRLTAHRTHGGGCARIFEIRVYE